MRAFELDWLGGKAETFFRSRDNSTPDHLPWDSLRPEDYPAKLVARARESWTHGAFQEYCTAAAFSKLVSCLLAIGAPIDLIGMASAFIVDEMRHVELNARMAMQLGGATASRVDFSKLVADTPSDLTRQQKTNELVVRICCVGEGLSVPLLAKTAAAASHPLTKAVLQRIAKDEVAHAQFGQLYLAWVDDKLDDVERKRLADVAMEALDAHSSDWQDLTSKVVDGVTSEGYLLDHVNALGWLDSDTYHKAAQRAVTQQIVKPLGRAGINLPLASVAALF